MPWLTEADPPYPEIERLDTEALLEVMNKEDCRVAEAVREAIPAIASWVEGVVRRMRGGGRLIYVGSGTSGRLGVLDAAECPPTFGVSPDRVIGLIAGGAAALRGPVEAAEDNEKDAVADLQRIGLSAQDAVFAISASGRTPYALAAARYAQEVGALTGCFTANPDTPLASLVEYPVVVLTGPEVLAGSTRLKAGTATKLVLNMISTAVFTRLGHVRGSRMIDLQLVNRKLWGRALRYLIEATGLPEAEAEALLRRTGSLRAAIEAARSLL